MKEQLPFQLRLNQNLTDLNPVVVGEGRFRADHYTGPLVAGEAYMIHYVRCGKGEYLYNGNTYPSNEVKLGENVVVNGELVFVEPAPEEPPIE